MKNGYMVFFVLTYFTISRSYTQTITIQNFLYQLENLDLNAVGSTGFDLVIMDYSSDGTEAGEYSKDQIEALKTGSCGEKLVIAYMSIGEAEDYRFYWEDDWQPGNPSWIGDENPDWGGNYMIRYWDEAWQTIIFEYLHRIVDAGFDGVYLDLIDAYESYLFLSSVQVTKEMVDFVGAIRDTARSYFSDFLVFGQNGAELAVIEPTYLSVVDGIGQ